MIIFGILAVALFFLISFVVLIAGAGGAIATILLSDVIVCIAIIVLIARLIWKRKHR